jgi:hypothetical protein
MTRGLAPVVGLTLAVMLVAGCDKPTPRAVYTVNYYRTHEDFRLAKIKECEGAGERKQGDPDCLNAIAANNPVASN